MAHPSPGFGEELRKRRLAAGLSLTALSGEVHYSKAQLSKVERGIKTPSHDLARLCDAALGAGGELIALVPKGTPETPAEPEPGQVEEEDWIMELSPDGPNRFHPVGRRQVMGAGVASLMTWRPDGTGPATPAAGAGMLEASRSLFTHYRKLGQSVAPGLLLPVLIAQTHTLRELSAHSDPATRRQLLALGSRYDRLLVRRTRRVAPDDMAAAGGGLAAPGHRRCRPRRRVAARRSRRRGGTRPGKAR